MNGKNERIGTPTRSILKAWFASGFVVTSILFVLVLLRGPSGPTPMASLLSEGIVLAETADGVEAERAFRAVAESDDSLLAAMAYHNLGVMALRAASRVSDSERPVLAREAAGMAENSLALRPGRLATSQVLELALRWSEEGLPPEDPNEPPQTGEQSRDEDADTRIGGTGANPVLGRRPDPASTALGPEAALRLLRSFRLMESEGTRRLVQSLLAPSMNAATTERKGPPW